MNIDRELEEAYSAAKSATFSAARSVESSTRESSDSAAWAAYSAAKSATFSAALVAYSVKSVARSASWSESRSASYWTESCSEEKRLKQVEMIKEIL